MRFESIELQRYGHFSDRRLDFPRRDHDFHMIVGGNEAGKSTLRQAFHDLLFGIPLTTPMTFLHPGPELALNAVLTGELGQLVMGRRRKRTGGLVDAAGERLSDDVLGRWLGGVSEAFYERMFGLDHRRLEQGSRAMLQAGDDVDSVLFQAAAGVAALNKVLTALRNEAAGLWTPHHSKNRAWYAASDRYKEADREVRAATVRPNAWVEAQRVSSQADQAFEAAREECAQLRLQLRELERLRRLAPLLVQIRECELKLGADSEAQQASSPLLEFEADILALEETRLQVAGHRSEIGQCDSHISLLQEQLSGVLRQLGRPISASADAAAIEVVASALPSKPLRSEIVQLLNEGRQLRTRREAAMQARQARLAEIEELRARIAALPRVKVGAALRRALDAATAAGDMAAARDTLEGRAAQQQLELERRLAALRQPEMADGLPDLGRLVQMEPWPAEALVERVQRRRELQADVDTIGRQLREAEAQLMEARLKAEQFRRTRQVVSRDEVMDARRERDGLWEALAQGREVLETHAQAYAALVLRADLLVDRQLEAADDAARLQTLEHECERMESGLQTLRDMQKEAVNELAAYDEQWREECLQRKLPHLPPANLQGWLPGREAALQANERLQVTLAELESVRRRHDSLLSTLLAALHTEAAEHPGVGAVTKEAELSLAEACDTAREILVAADAAAARREALREQLQRLEPLMPGLEQECNQTEVAYEAWLNRRGDALERAGFERDADDAYVEAALELLADADELLRQLRERRAARDAFEAQLRHFSVSVSALAARLQVADFQADQADEQLRRWVAQLEPLRTAVRDREHARQQLATLNTRLLEEAQGWDRQKVEAELAGVEPSSLAAQAEALSLELEEAEHRRDRLAAEREQARSALDAISGSDDAAQAEARRQEALADMADVAERYVKVYAQYRLLEHVTERYRERSQGPLLQRASQLFAALTLGAHEGLVVDGEVAALWARRADGRRVPLDGLSDGTRDQLYLALRLAALELYMDSAEPMPFIADDLFVNYDDDRALAGLRQLTEVSRRTQVIFLTHHAHMVELARDNLAERVHVVELSA